MSLALRRLQEGESTWDIPRSSTLRWPRDALWALFRPFQFYGTEIHRMSLAGASVSAAINIAILTLAVGLITSLYDFGHGGSALALRNMAIASASGVGWVFGLALLLAGGMAGTRDFGEARRRAFRVAASTTAVILLAALFVSLQLLTPLAVLTFFLLLSGGEVFGVVTVISAAWMAVLLFAALLMDQSPLDFEDEQVSEDILCEQCGFDLRIVPREGACPECGYSYGASVDAFRGRLSPVERDPSVRSAAATWLAAVLWPGRFWSSRAARVDCDSSRNAYLMTVLVTAALGCLATVVVACLNSDDLSFGRVVELLVIMPFVSAIAVAPVLLLNQAVVLVGTLLARLGGCPLTFSQVARLGYHSVALPAIFEVMVAIVLLWLAMDVFGRDPEGQVLTVSLVLVGGLVAWSLWTIQWAARAVRYANR